MHPFVPIESKPIQCSIARVKECVCAHFFLSFSFCFSHNFQIIGFQSDRISSSKWWICPCICTVDGAHAPNHFVFYFCSCSIHCIFIVHAFTWTRRPEIDSNARRTHTPLIKSNGVLLIIYLSNEKQSNVVWFALILIRIDSLSSHVCVCVMSELHFSCLQFKLEILVAFFFHCTVHTLLALCQ